MAVADEDTVLLMMFSWASQRGNICCGHKMFLKKSEKNLSRTNFVSSTNVPRAGKQGNIRVRNSVSVYESFHIHYIISLLSRENINSQLSW